MPLIDYQTLISALEKPLLKYLAPAPARALSEIFASNSLEGVYSHGVNRYPRVLGEFASGLIDPTFTESERTGGLGGYEVRDGHMGVGPLMADHAMHRAVTLAKTHGIACVSVRNGNHWLRAGRYGQIAADAGMIGLCFTNTTANMIAWGSMEARAGNNPMCIAVPFSRGNIVLDMAASQFSYGKLEVLRQQGKRLPVDGGYDDDGRLTRDPIAILTSKRMLPAGLWKGGALSAVIDMLVSALSMGRTTQMIAAGPAFEQGLSQTFIAIHYAAAVDAAEVDARLNQAIEYLTGAKPVDPASPVRYPGQDIARVRAENLKNGVPVNDGIWEKITALQ